MTGDDRCGAEGFGDVEGGKPLVDSRHTAGFRQVRVDAVIDGVAGNQQSGLRHVQDRRRVGVCVAHFDRQEPNSLQLETIRVDHADVHLASR